jgi:hypothetical protein
LCFTVGTIPLLLGNNPTEGAKPENDKNKKTLKIKENTVFTKGEFEEIENSKMVVTGAFQNYAATLLFWRGQGEVIINA